MKIPFLPLHILTTKNLAAKIEVVRKQVQASNKEAREKDNKALSRLLHNNHQLGLKVVELSQGNKNVNPMVKEKKDVRQAGNKSARD